MVGVQRLTELVRDDQIQLAVPRRPCSDTLLALTLSMHSKSRKGPLVDVDVAPRPQRLRWAHHDFLPRCCDGVRHCELTEVEVDIAPAQAKYFAAPHAGRAQESEADL